ncbi:MAG: OadG family protein [Elusimicrobiaceae bacterium]|nr:OadG family protein [Elusimicrobiaceae bacterium]
MSESLIGQAVNITLIGMSVVFVFLIILVLLMKGLGVAVQALEKYFPQTVPAASDHALIAVAIAAAKKFQGK